MIRTTIKGRNAEADGIGGSAEKEEKVCKIAGKPDWRQSSKRIDYRFSFVIGIWHQTQTQKTRSSSILHLFPFHIPLPAPFRETKRG